MKKDKELELEIEELISLKYEGPYWDYKEDYCYSKAEFLRDIIGMANNLENRDAFLIYGVSDQGEISGIENSTRRPNQNEVLQLLKGKKFAGGIRPEVLLTTLKLSAHEIDVLRIKNTTKTPYFLAESFVDGGRTVGAGNIYTRVGDITTDIDRTADIDKIEYL